eukprot:25069-Eustigmatos_ZCMA.PRE.1
MVFVMTILTLTMASGADDYGGDDGDDKSCCSNCGRGCSMTAPPAPKNEIEWGGGRRLAWGF